MVVTNKALTRYSASAPTAGALLIWEEQFNGGTGHVAVVLGKVDDRKVRVIDSNWLNDRKGRVHDVPITEAIRGWLVPD